MGREACYYQARTLEGEQLVTPEEIDGMARKLAVQAANIAIESIDPSVWIDGSVPDDEFHLVFDKMYDYLMGMHVTL